MKEAIMKTQLQIDAKAAADLILAALDAIAGES